MDSELLVNDATVEDIGRMCCTDFERERWLCGNDAALMATLIFSAKESFYKCVYAFARRFIDFSEVEAVTCDDRRLRMRLVTTPELRDHLSQFDVNFRIEGGMVHTAVCL